MINSLQVISYMTILTVSFPQITELFFDYLLNLSEFDIIPIDAITEWLFPFLKDFVHEYLEISARKLQKKAGGGTSTKGKDKSIDQEEVETN
jgi:hypothetical protein